MLTSAIRYWGDRMVWLWRAFWSVWMTAIVITEFLLPPNAISRPAIFISFLVMEYSAILRTEKGDTFSEWMWKFYASRKGRIPLVLGITAFFGVAMLEVGTQNVYTLAEVPVSRLCLVLGLVGWLVPHFLGRGKHG